MKNIQKTKAELVAELEQLHQRVTLLEQATKIDPKWIPLYKAVAMAPVAIWACDRAYTIVYWNPGAERIYRASRDKVIGKNFLELFVDKEEYDKAWNDLALVFKGKTVSPYLVADVLPDGTEITIQNVSFPIFDENGSVILLAEIGIDITENVLSRVHKTVVGSSAVSISACDENWRIMLWNPGAERIYQAPKHEVMGKSFLDLFASEQEKEGAINRLRRIFKGETVESYVATDVLLDGTTRYILTNTYPVYDASGNVILQAEIGQDITREELRRRTLSELRDQLNKALSMSELEILELIYEHSSKVMVMDFLYIALFDFEKNQISPGLVIENGCRIDASKDVDLILGTVEEGLIRWIIDEGTTQRPTDIGEAYKSHARNESVSRTPKSWMGVPLIVKGKVIGIIALKSYETENAYGQYEEDLLETIAGYAAIALENARAYKHLQELNTQIAKTQEMLTRYSISQDFVHRINNLAGTIPIWIELIREDLFDSGLRGGQILEYLDHIDKDIQDLLSRAAELQRPIQEEDIDMQTLLSSFLESVKLQYPAIEILQALSLDAISVRANYFQLSSAIDNLVTNAVESMSGSGTLWMQANVREFTGGKSHIEMVIRDSGIGIPPEKMSNLFELFYTTKGSGRGYGLWRSKNYIEEIGGTLQIASQLGVGTTVTITLPISQGIYARSV